MANSKRQRGREAAENELQRTYRGDAEPDESERVDGHFSTEKREIGMVIASLPSGDEEEADRLAELRELLKTAGVEVAHVMVQHRERPDPKTYFGKGKLDELIEEKRGIHPDVIVAEGELTPSQQRHLEDRLKLRVVDRTAVILDIFAQHATSAEGKLQVELAQLDYSYARQEGLWQHLERLGGGVGTRGPGESQLESDRRLIRTRMGALKTRLKELERTRGVMRRRRLDAGVPRVALAGYTNAGKSTLMNALTGAGVSVNDALFETLDPTVRTFEHEGMQVLLSDTVGFIRHLPHELVAAFRSTLDEAIDAHLILHVADASASDRRRFEQSGAVDEVLADIGAAETPRTLVLNKVDLLSQEQREELRDQLPDAIQVSAASGEGMEELRQRLVRLAREQLTEIELFIPYSRGDLVSAVYAVGRDIVQESEERGSRIRARLPPADAHRIQQDLASSGGKT